jgi:aerobic carbon-monoxide dehydrogenase medium subunit
MESFEYHRPRSLEEALQLRRAHENARYISGGTDVLVQIHKLGRRPDALVSLSSIPELQGIELDGRELRIGAATPIREIVRHEGLRELCPVLALAAGRLGSPQIRNRATIGGNLCNASPCADTATPLLVLEARVRARGERGIRELSLEELFRGPGGTRLEDGEILTDILVPRPAPGARATFRKKGRVHMDLAVASVAVLVELDGPICRRARLAAGSVAPVPLRLRPVEELLAGKPLDAAVIAAAGAAAERAVSPITDIRSTEEYRRRMVGVFVRRALEELARPGAESRSRP